jgi:spore maturation protein CgeB
LKILYQIPSLETVYAGRFIYEGYKDAFTDLGHQFRPLTSKDDAAAVLEEYRPDILISSLNFYNLKFLDLKLVRRYRDEGLVLFNQIRPWNRQVDQPGASALSENQELIGLISSGLAGDVFFHYMEQDDPAMHGFEQGTGYPFHTILLAANRKRFFPEFDRAFEADVSFVGSYLPDKRDFLRRHVLPLRKKYRLRLYGSDWTLADRLLGLFQKAGQYFDVDALKSLRRLKLPLDDERKVYASSLVSLNCHEDHQRRFGGDFNERTLKIMASGGFEITDKVKVLRKYFSEHELVIAEDTGDWFDKIEHFVRNPESRLPYIQAGRARVLEEHTYHNRVDQILGIFHAHTGRTVGQ